ncbi:hypothetical protein [Cellulomonas sp.]|uniref:hypothetical protein n=1 Tax=Cellulomonas sp. TaxID=40001 RepID=UPI003BACFAB2
MSDELHALLARASDQIEVAAPALDGGRLGLVRSAARRRRIARHTAESFVSVGVVGVLGVGLWFGLGQQAPEPVVPVQTPTISPTPSVTPTPTTTPTPKGPPTRAESVDDATVIARLSAPRTGEVWQTPVPAPEMASSLLGEDWYDDLYRVGTRGDAVIYAAFASEGYVDLPVDALIEVDPDGARLIACPSARSGDPCAPENSNLAASVVRDEVTFYDTLTLPHAIDLGGGYVVRTTSTTSSPTFRDVYGVRGEGTLPSRSLKSLGALSLVTDEFESYGAQVSSFRFAVRTPFGSLLVLAPGDVPGGDFSAIRWNQGFAPDPSAYESEVAVAPAVNGCYGARFSRDTDHVAAQWRVAGATAEGVRVYVPVEGGNPIASTVRSWQEEFSWTMSEPGDPRADEYGTLHGGDAGYGFLTDEAFLGAHALYAVEGPAGEWLLALRQGALSVIWECV